MSAIDIATALIHKWEGCKLAAYPDPVTGGDPWTIGYGATGQNITQGTVWTQDQADLDLYTRLTSIANQIDNNTSYTMDDNQLGACCSLAYNIGINQFLASTLFAKWNDNDPQGTADQFAVWNKSGGHVVQGLVNRRADEQRVFCGGMP